MTPDLDRIRGEVLEVSYRDDLTGYTVAKVVTPEGETVTVVGSFPLIMAGERLSLLGRWGRHQRYGLQFRAEKLRVEMPVSEEGLVRYLSSGLLPGVGPSVARRIVEAFGGDTLEVLDNHPERLLEVPGIGAKRLDEIRRRWEEHRHRRHVMMEIMDYGIGFSMADRIFCAYGDLAPQVIRNNPYQLAYDVKGIGFVTADQIAKGMGFDDHAPERLDAGLVFVLRRSIDDGHSMLPQEDLLRGAERLLNVRADLLSQRLELLCQMGTLEREILGGMECIYHPFLRRAEEEVARAVMDLAASGGPRLKWELDLMISALEGQWGMTLEGPQREAVKGALSHRIFVITGGPGTGKTTLLRFTAALCESMGLEVLLMAPTGRAAKRMSEVTGLEASTVHRALGYDPRSGGFQRGSGAPLEADVVVVDEFSMVDLPLFHGLLSALGDGCSLVLVGDVNQLPSIGPGTVLNDLISSGAVPKVELSGVFRQAEESLVVSNSYRILRGEELEMPSLDDGFDFAFVEEEDPIAAAELVAELVGYEIPRRTGLDPMWDVQVLTPMHKGEVGARALCLRLQEVLNPSGEPLRRGEGAIRRGDKVIQLKNDYDLDIYNGDIGIVREAQGDGLVLDFEGRPVKVGADGERNIALAYALTIHKSQGSEYPAVVVPVLSQHSSMLKRNLLYTALTRAKRLAVLVGSRRAVSMAVKVKSDVCRYGALKWRLSSLIKGGSL
ncbi:helicase, putative, RecD/TraA family [Thermanaerovibrio velox DSM 12556]|uniref:ATP-dependent RecD2 DNA helicase n=1 Tax=Thermanaerovibrio velox DSM 12556 TaxID=926567 RepID=H0UNL0_9BACT|nr:ATP-dependent RecD-like DNA helicase [Thermanaerovibrio velox]EHM10425.1 helicase, putative, RecD/TraA family [Thermanaerovibrio velox DSM 12556]